MRTNYPEYKRGELETLYLSLSKPDKKTLDDFIAYCRIGAGERKADDMQRSIIQFQDTIQKPFDKIELEDLRHFLALLNQSKRTKYTKNGVKIHIKKFLRWKFKDWSIRFDELKDIRQQKAFNEEKINEGTILKKAQIEKIMAKEKDFIKKTFFITLYESGLRPQELRTIKRKNIILNSDGDISELHIFATKTSKARAVYVKEATFYLKKLLETTESEYVFPSPEDDKQPLPRSTCFLWIQQMGENVGLKIFPYLLRHSRATELYLNMPSKVAQKFMGHGQDMSDLYSHISSKEVKDAMIKSVYKLEELPPEKKHELERDVDNLKEFVAILMADKMGKKIDKKQLINLYNKLNSNNKAIVPN